MNFQLKYLLNLKLAHHILNSEENAYDTYESHCLDLLKTVRGWLKLSDVENHDDETHWFKQKLVKLFVTTASRHYAIKETPRDLSEWTRLLLHWTKQNTCSDGDLIKEREVYFLMAVDGFSGFKVKDLRKYLVNLFSTLRDPYKTHHRAVRRMYEWLDQSAVCSSLTGTDSACVVFLALLKVYDDNKLAGNDHSIKFHLNSVRQWTEGFLHQHAHYYKVIQSIDNLVLDELGRVYVEAFPEWNKIGYELIATLENFII